MIYKEIPSCPGYKISKEGVVIGKKGNILKVGRNSVSLFISNKSIQKSVKSLLSETWFVDGWIDQLEQGEHWKEIKGFNQYIITSHGRVWSKSRHIWLKPRLNRSYYWRLQLMSGGSRHWYNIHALVGRHFLNDYKVGLDILHKQEELPYPEINYVDNLWVGTASDNKTDMLKKERHNKSNDNSYIGVIKSEGSVNYSYRILHNGKRLQIGGFITAKEAHIAYLAKRIQLKGV